MIVIRNITRPGLPVADMVRVVVTINAFRANVIVLSVQQTYVVAASSTAKGRTGRTPSFAWRGEFGCFDRNVAGDKREAASQFSRSKRCG